VNNLLNMIERVIVLTLLSLMMLVVVASVAELAIVIINQLIAPPFLLLNITEILKVFGFFLMVLIGLELLETLKAYLSEDRVHAEVVLLVAMVAIARKVIILDFNEYTPTMLMGMSSIIVALGISYFLVRRALHPFDVKHVPPQD